jgi:hypothetical protein
VPKIGALLGLMKLFSLISWLNERKFEKSIKKDNEKVPINEFDIKEVESDWNLLGKSDLNINRTMDITTVLLEEEEDKD